MNPPKLKLANKLILTFFGSLTGSKKKEQNHNFCHLLFTEYKQSGLD